MQILILYLNMIQFNAQLIIMEFLHINIICASLRHPKIVKFPFWINVRFVRTIFNLIIITYVFQNVEMV